MTPVGNVVSRKEAKVRLANFTMHNQSDYVEAFRGLGYEMEAEPRLVEVDGTKDAIRLVRELFNCSNLPMLRKNFDGILIGGRTDLAIYIAMYAVAHGFGVYLVETERIRVADMFRFNLKGVTQVAVSYPDINENRICMELNERLI